MCMSFHAIQKIHRSHDEITHRVSGGHDQRFPSKNGVSDTMSPAAMVDGKNKLDMGMKMLEFGSYAMVYVGTKNNTKQRSVPAIALLPSNNAGGFFFMSLYTGKKLHAYVWKELPIDENVIERVEYLATKEKQPYHMDNNPIFEWSPGIAVDEEEQEEDENDEDTGVDQEPQDGELAVIDEEEEEQETTDNIYITDDETVLHEESGSEESDIDEVINNMENVDNQIDDIMNDINQSRYNVEESDKNDISGDNEPEDIILDDLG